MFYLPNTRFAGLWGWGYSHVWKRWTQLEQQLFIYDPYYAQMPPFWRGFCTSSVTNTHSHATHLHTCTLHAHVCVQGMSQCPFNWKLHLEGWMLHEFRDWRGKIFRHCSKWQSPGSGLCGLWFMCWHKSPVKCSFMDQQTQKGEKRTPTFTNCCGVKLQNMIKAVLIRAILQKPVTSVKFNKIAGREHNLRIKVKYTQQDCPYMFVSFVIQKANMSLAIVTQSGSPLEQANSTALNWLYLGEKYSNTSKVMSLEDTQMPFSAHWVKMISSNCYDIVHTSRIPIFCVMWRY